MALLSKDAILGADDRPTKDVEVPQWGGTVRLRALSGTERDAFEASTMVFVEGKPRRPNLANLRARFLALCIVDDNGDRLFGEDEVHALGAKSVAALDLLFTEARKLSRLTNKDLEELTADFGDAQSDGSTSG
jgi:hypothetical protein